MVKKIIARAFPWQQSGFTFGFTENVSKTNGKWKILENCEKCAEMFSKELKNAQILLKSQSAQECWKCKIVCAPKNCSVQWGRA